MHENTKVVVRREDHIQPNELEFKQFSHLFHDNMINECIDVSHLGYSTLSQNGEFVKVHKVMRRFVNEDLYQITFRNGKELQATGDHLLTVNKQTIKVSELKVGDKLPVATYPKHMLQYLKEVNLIDLFKEDQEIVISNWNEIKRSLSSDVRAKVNKVLNTIREFNHLNANWLTLKEYGKVRLIACLDESKLQLRGFKGRCSIPAILPLTEQLGKFLGYIASEGYVAHTNKMVVFMNKDKVLIDDFVSCTKQVFGDNVNITVDERNCTFVRVFGRVIAKLFSGALLHKTHSSDISLPSWFKFSEESFIQGFLEAEIAGDGSIQGNQISITSVSKQFVKDMSELLAYRNINASISVCSKKGSLVRFANGVTSTRNFDAYSLRFTKNPKKQMYSSVKEIDRVRYKGYVYDFETEDHHFSANGMISHNCCQLDLNKIFSGGFNTGHGYLREPNSIRAYAALSCIVVQSSQNDFFGGQSINAFDFYMAPGVKKSFVKAFKHNLKIAEKAILKSNDVFESLLEKSMEELPRYKDENAMNALINEFLENFDDDVISSKAIIRALRFAFQQACEDVEEETHQAMEAVVFNFNTLQSRAGSQVPFSSLNLGTDTSNEGRLVIKELLNALYAGLGHGETSIFPIVVWKMKDGVNFYPGDPNYDLYQQSIKCSAKRLFPTYMNLSATYNAKYYKPGNIQTEVATMGCRTRVMGNVNGPEESGSRGNFAFTTLNLPKFAIEANHDIGKFFMIMDKYVKLAHDYLLERFYNIAKKHVYNFPFSMGEKMYMGSENLKKTDTILPALKNASISIGFCGLAECLTALIGEHHGESERAQQLGITIVAHLRALCDQYIREDHLNWSAFATPKLSWALAM